MKFGKVQNVSSIDFSVGDRLYMADNGDITQASTISNFIKENRIEVTKENITRKISKNKSESID